MRREPAPPAGVLVCFGLAVLGAVGFAVSYVLNLGNVAFGLSLGGAFAFLAAGLAIWSKRIEVREPQYVEERAVGPSPPQQFEAFQEALTSQPVPRSRVLWSMLGLTLAAIGGAVLFPLRSLFLKEGGSPDAILEHTPWSKGLPLVDEDGKRIRPGDLTYDSVKTVFPAGVSSRVHPDTTTVLVRVEPASLQLPAGRENWVVDGVVGYSKLCTHAGCPVGLYAADYRQLMCPCHHSLFDVLRGAVPIEGPAARPLPQLPLGVDADGYLVATGDFNGPVGAGWWGLPT
ncbi:QcrA and Rieske domain-containing protein [Actinopolymorpha singaporensis]